MHNLSVQYCAFFAHKSEVKNKFRKNIVLTKSLQWHRCEIQYFLLKIISRDVFAHLSFMNKIEQVESVINMYHIKKET